MADQQIFHGGACTTMSLWNPAAAFDTPPASQFFHSSAVGDYGHQSFLPVEYDRLTPTGIIESSINPLMETFLPEFFEPELMKDIMSYDNGFLEFPSVLLNHQGNFTNASPSLPEPSTNFSHTQFVKQKKNVIKEIEIEPPSKKPRIGMPSSLPSFKVRKEKLGDRITALQQLVSPFGKTDTASVLHEAIEYIKFLHDQVGVLSTPYLKDDHQMPHIINGTEERSNNLRSDGLCLVPIQNTFALFANEYPMDFWTPNFGGSYK